MTQAALALLHSPLTSAAAWGDLPAVLEDRGHLVVVPEVLDDDQPPYAQKYIARVAVQLATDLPDTRLVLIGHSGAGPLLPQIGFARHAAGVPVSGYVFLDAMLPRVPQAATRLEILAIEDPAFAAGLAEQLHAGQRFPDWAESELTDQLPDPSHRAVLLAGLRPRSLEFFTEPLPMSEDWPDARCGYLQLSPAYDLAAATAVRRGWAVQRIAAHHFAALNEPTAVADALISLLQQM
jgi:hypothetical protein